VPLKAPELDDRSFDDLMREALLRVPRYTPEWTDFNDSDPGVTLLQLFAWLTETTLYRLNQVPERNYVKFLQLLDMELRPAKAAVAYLTFTVERPPPEGAGRRRLWVPPGTQATAQPPAGGNPIVFETEEGLDLVPVPLANVQVYDGSSFTEVTAANQAGDPAFRPLGWVPQLGSALYLGFAETDPSRGSRSRRFPDSLRLRFVLPTGVEERLTVLTGAGLPAPRPAGPAPDAALLWEYQATTGWQRLQVFQDDTAGLTREGDVVLQGPPDATLGTAGKLGQDEPRYWLRCRLVRGGYEAGQEPLIDFVRPNVVRASNLTSVHEEAVGTSEGHPDQSFELAHRPVEAGSLELRTEQEGIPPERWSAVEDLLTAEPTDPAFTLNETAGRIRFGDGRHGRIPVAGARIVARTYRWGGGAAGNVEAGLVNALRTGLDVAVRVVNERPATGGRDEQDVEELKALAPQRLRHRGRAVTAEDYAALAREAGPIATATALPLVHPDFPEAEVPGAVTVVVVPESRALPPRPSAALLRQVSEYLDRFRPLATELHVVGPRYLAIRVDVTVVAQPFQAFGAVAQAVEGALGAFLDPLSQGFGHDLYPSRFIDVILDAAGVHEVGRVHGTGSAATALRPALSVYVDDRLHDSFEPVVVPADSLVYGAGYQVNVVPFEDR